MSQISHHHESWSNTCLEIALQVITSSQYMQLHGHILMFHHQCRLWYDRIEDKSNHDDQKQYYVVVFAAALVLNPLLCYESQGTSLGFRSAIKPFLASAGEARDLGLTLWPLIIHTRNMPYIHGIPLPRHRWSIYLSKMHTHTQIYIYHEVNSMKQLWNRSNIYSKHS